MVLQRNTGVSTGDEDAEDDESNENYGGNITGKHKATRKKNFVGIAEDLDNVDKVESKGKSVVTAFLIYASVLINAVFS